MDEAWIGLAGVALGSLLSALVALRVSKQQNAHQEKMAGLELTQARRDEAYLGLIGEARRTAAWAEAVMLFARAGEAPVPPGSKGEWDRLTGLLAVYGSPKARDAHARLQAIHYGLASVVAGAAQTARHWNEERDTQLETDSEWRSLRAEMAELLATMMPALDAFEGIARSDLGVGLDEAPSEP